MIAGTLLPGMVVAREADNLADTESRGPRCSSGGKLLVLGGCRRGLASQVSRRPAYDRET